MRPRTRPRPHFLVLAVAIMAVMPCCDDDSVEAPQPTRLVLNSPDATFIAKSQNTAGGSADKDALFEVLTDGTVQPAEWLDASGNPVDVEVSRQKRLDDSHLAFEIIVYEQYHNVVMDMATGDLLDFSDYDYDSLTMYDGMLYGIDFQTVYRADLSSLTATPMNNPGFNGAGNDVYYTYDLIVTAGGWAHIRTSLGDKQMLAPDNSPPVASWIDNVVDLGPGDVTGVYCTILSKDGHFYKVGVEGSGTVGSPTQILYGTIDDTYDPGPVIHENTMGYVPDDYVARIPFGNHDVTERYYVVRDGFVVISSTAAGALQFRWVPKDFGFLGNEMFQYAVPQSPRELVGNRLYWESAGVVTTADIVLDSSGVVLVDDPNMISWYVAGDGIVYSTFVTGTEVATYRVAADGTSTLLESLDMEVRDVLNFVVPDPPP